MTTYIQRPTSDGLSHGTISKTGGPATFFGCMGDNSDSTKSIWSTAGYVYLNVPQITLASGEVIQRYRVVSRHDNTNSTSKFFVTAVDAAGFASSTADLWNTTIAASTPTTNSGAYRTTSPTGGALTPSSLGAIYLNDIGSTGHPTVYDTWIEIVTDNPPVVTVTSIGSFSSGQLNVTWTYTDAEGDTQASYRVRVFNSAQYGAGGFNPLTSTAYADSGEVFSAVQRWICPTLAVNDTYKAYVQLSDTQGVYSDGTATSGANVIAAAVPATPAVVATADNTNARASLVFQDNQNELSANDSSFETSVAGWTAVSNCAISQVLTGVTNIDGSYAMQVQASGVGTMTARGPLTSTTGGQALSALAYSRPVNFGQHPNYQVSLAFYDSGSALISTSAGTAITEGFATFTPAYVSVASTPSNAAFAAVVLTWTSQVGTEQHWVDGVTVVPYASTSFAWSPGGLVTPSRLQVQRSADGGTTWTQLTRVFLNSTTSIGDMSAFNYPDETQTFTAFDYESVRGTALLYRVRNVSIVGANTLVSPWSATSSVTLTAGDWRLKQLALPANNWQFHPALSDLEWKFSYDTNDSTSHPLGSSYEVVSADAVTGAHVAWDATITSDADYASYTALRNSLQPLLLQSPWGEQFYGKFQGTHTLMRIVDGDNSEPKRTASATFVETATP